jgi:hypothetical protein
MNSKRINNNLNLIDMKILVEAQNEVKVLNGEDFEELKAVLQKIKVKYDIGVEIKNFTVNYDNE